jgi:hypothetical protein
MLLDLFFTLSIKKVPEQVYNVYNWDIISKETIEVY